MMALLPAEHVMELAELKRKSLQLELVVLIAAAKDMKSIQQEASGVNLFPVTRLLVAGVKGLVEFWRSSLLNIELSKDSFYLFNYPKTPEPS